MISNEILAQHVPVLPDETIQYLNCQSEGVYIDGTIGLGGHSEKILEATPPGTVLIGIDLDSECLSI
ncbi:MAG: 16S rRNA (cytosine(1402)-N(4))-methyltransferase, partial [bacterium]